MAKDYSSWKQKIDPAFDKFIKLYLEFLGKILLPGNEGYLAPDDRNFKILETSGFPSLVPMYEQDKPEDALTDLGILLGETATAKEVKAIKKEAKKKKNYFKVLTEIAEKMEENSRNYYLSAFEPFISEETFNEYTSNLNEKAKKGLIKNIKGDVNSLYFNCIAMPIEKDKKEIQQKLQSRIQSKKFSTSLRMTKRNLFYTWDAISIMVNGKSLKDLFIKARKGDDDSLFKLVKVDKTLFDHDWVRIRIRKAMYSGDIEFFKFLSEAIKADPMKTRRYKLLIFIVLVYFWKFGLHKLTVPEIMQLLQDSGLEVREDEVTFRKHYDRIKPFLESL